MRPSPNRRNARTRSRNAVAASATASSGILALHIDHRQQMRRTGRLERRRLLGRPVDLVGSREHQSRSEGQLRRGQGETVQRSDHHDRFAVGPHTVLQPLQGGPQMLGPKLEVALTIKHVLEQRAQRQAGPLPRLRGRLRGTPGEEIATEAVQLADRHECPGVAGQGAQRSAVLADELAGERPVAVQRRAAGSRRLGDDLKRNLLAGRRLLAERQRRLLDEHGDR